MRDLSLSPLDLGCLFVSQMDPYVARQQTLLLRLRRGFPGVHNEDQNRVLFPGNFNVLGERKEMNIFKIVHCR